jgi:hypothetical protein
MHIVYYIRRFNILIFHHLPSSGNIMFKSFRDKITLSGIALLAIGVALLMFTFVSAYWFLTQSPNIIASNDMAQTFGDALAPLIATCIRLMYLGVMGWVASLMTIRGVTIVTHMPKSPPLNSQQQPITEQEPQTQTQSEKMTEDKPEQTAKPQEPEAIVIPAETIGDPQQSNS